MLFTVPLSFPALFDLVMCTHEQLCIQLPYHPPRRLSYHSSFSPQQGKEQFVKDVLRQHSLLQEHELRFEVDFGQKVEIQV